MSEFNSLEEEKKFYHNACMPEGEMGRQILDRMNIGHGPLVDWGMKILDGVSAQKLLDIGCGGGRNTVAMMKRFPDAHMTAVDYSETSVRQTTEYAADEISKGLCDVLYANVTGLPFDDASFDLASGFETVYFWPGPVESLREVCRVLKPGGKLFLVNEADGFDEEGKKFETIIDEMTAYTIEQLSKALTEAGFSSVKSIHHPDMPWIALLAEKL